MASSSPRLRAGQQEHQQELPGPIVAALQGRDQALQLAVLRISLAMRSWCMPMPTAGLTASAQSSRLTACENIARTAASVRFAATGLSASGSRQRAHVPALDRLDLHRADRGRT